MPTEVATPWPSGPVVVSIPVVMWDSGWPGVGEPSWRKFWMSSRLIAGSSVTTPSWSTFLTPARWISE